MSALQIGVNLLRKSETPDGGKRRLMSLARGWSANAALDHTFVGRSISAPDAYDLPADKLVIPFQEGIIGNYAKSEERHGASPLQMMSRRFRQPREMPRHHLRAGPVPFFGFRERQSIGKFNDGPRHVVGQAGVRAGCGCFCGRPGKHVAFPGSGSTLWRRHVPAYVILFFTFTIGLASSCCLKPPSAVTPSKAPSALSRPLASSTRSSACSCRLSRSSSCRTTALSAAGSRATCSVTRSAGPTRWPTAGGMFTWFPLATLPKASPACWCSWP